MSRATIEPPSLMQFTGSCCTYASAEWREPKSSIPIVTPALRSFRNRAATDGRSAIV
jgi:hypothetical protein